MSSPHLASTASSVLPPPQDAATLTPHPSLHLSCVNIPTKTSRTAPSHTAPSHTAPSDTHSPSPLLFLPCCCHPTLAKKISLFCSAQFPPPLPLPHPFAPPPFFRRTTSLWVRVWRLICAESGRWLSPSLRPPTRFYSRAVPSSPRLKTGTLTLTLLTPPLPHLYPTSNPTPQPPTPTIQIPPPPSPPPQP